MTFYTLFKGKFNTGSFLTKDLKLKICGTEGMTSYRDIIVSVFRKLFHLKYQFERIFDDNDFLGNYMG